MESEMMAFIEWTGQDENKYWMFWTTQNTTDRQDFSVIY